MKKIIALILIGILALSTAGAFAATYNHDDDLSFTYDDAYFTITMDDHTDDEDLVILSDKNNGFVRIHLADLDDGEKFPTAEEVATAQNVEVETLETWGNFKNVVTYTYTIDTYTETVFIAPVYDDDGDVDDILTVNIGAEKIENEDAAMERSDRISEIVDTLKADD